MSKKTGGYKPSKGKGVLERYNERETKKQIGNSLLKTGVDSVSGAVVGTGIGFLAGKWAILVGPALFFTGHYLGDKSGLLRVAGAATMAYGIASAIQNKEISGTVDGISLSGETSKVKARYENWKEQMKVAFFLDKIFKSDEQKAVEGIGELDLASLDMFEDFNEMEARNFESARSYDAPPLPDFTSNAPSQETAFSIIEDEEDFSRF